jgi:hypothetical protein
MAEPERRRRRLRPSSSSASPATVPAPGVETPGTPATAPMTEQPRPPTTEQPRPPTTEQPRPPVSDQPRPPMEQARPPRTPPSRRPTSGAGTGAGAASAGPEDREAERGLRGLVGSGSSQVSVGAAMRARDAARPTDEQLADAAANLPIVRRNWQPREELPKR